jgi:hypothetical protein
MPEKQQDLGRIVEISARNSRQARATRPLGGASFGVRRNTFQRFEMRCARQFLRGKLVDGVSRIEAPSAHFVHYESIVGTFCTQLRMPIAQYKIVTRNHHIIDLV